MSFPILPFREAQAPALHQVRLRSTKYGCSLDQTEYLGWCGSMAGYCGQTGVIDEVKSDGDIRVKFSDGETWCYNPR
eukprot:COSAG02_NODE_19853_length_861_cov_1.437008_1_plen_76_part_10